MEQLMEKEISEKLSSEFELVRLKRDAIGKIPELAHLLSEAYYAQAKIDDNKVVHLRIVSYEGLVFEGTTTDYSWCLNNISF